MSAPLPTLDLRPLNVRAPFPVRRGLTLFLGTTLALWFLASAQVTWAGERSPWLHGVLTAPALYFLCICVHDGVHGVLWSKRRVNQVAGFVLALVILLPFPFLQAAHLQHHRRVGHADDPEHAVYSVSLAQLLLRLPLIPLLYLRSWVHLRPGARGWTLLHAALVVGASALLISTGGARQWAAVWIAPAMAAIVWFGFTTVYVPHSRYADRLMRYLTTHSGWHHDHHADVRYPFSQYIQLRDFHLRTGRFAGTRHERRVIGWLAQSTFRTTTAAPRIREVGR